MACLLHIFLYYILQRQRATLVVHHNFSIFIRRRGYMI